MNTMPSKRDSAHALYETYFLMNFVQLPPKKPLKHFYLHRIVPVTPEAHYQVGRSGIYARQTLTCLSDTPLKTSGTRPA